MKKNWMLMAFLCLGFSTLFFTSCDDDDVTPVTPINELDAVAYLQTLDDYSTLVEAVIKADLVTTLQGAGPFTIFAPDNDAFDTFLQAAGTGSVANTPADLLKSILLNHVIMDDVKSTALNTGYVNTAATSAVADNRNLSMYVDLTNGVRLNGVSSVTTADIDIANGTVHQVDAVIGLPTVVTFAAADPTFSTLVAALTDSRLTTDFVATLSGNGPFTVFAPTNEAFVDLLELLQVGGLAEIDAATLAGTLTSHVTTAGNVQSSDLEQNASIPTLNVNTTLSVNLDNTPPQLVGPTNTVNIIATDVQANNGVIHAIDTVILEGN